MTFSALLPSRVTILRKIEYIIANTPPLHRHTHSYAAVEGSLQLRSTETCHCVGDRYMTPVAAPRKVESSGDRELVGGALPAASLSGRPKHRGPRRLGQPPL